MRWLGHTTLIGLKNNTGFWCGDVKDRDQIEDLGIDGRAWDELI
jgi:hypothetical protein